MTEFKRPIRSNSAKAIWAGLGSAPRTNSIISFIIFQTFAGFDRKALIWAYSSGSYLSHRPPALRKSGMPLSTDIPAPVNAMVLRESAMSVAALLIKASLLPCVIFTCYLLLLKRGWLTYSLFRLEDIFEITC